MDTKLCTSLLTVVVLAITSGLIQAQHEKEERILTTDNILAIEDILTPDNANILLHKSADKGAPKIFDLLLARIVHQEI
ncbi:MAG: hypothetical protein FH748_16285 [Balneolaceae bacterium]|nr:hypothetical protein [Balneolaceae bacterium]